MPFVFRQGSTRVTAPVLRFSSGTLSLVAGEAVYAPSGGGGGTSDHTALSNLGWASSAHTGTASRLAGFDSGGAAAVVSVSSPLTYSGTTLSIQAASGSQAGYLSSSDWSTFNGKEPAISAGTTSQYWRGDKSWQALDKAAVGLGNVENTALSTWAGSANLTTLGTIGTGTWHGSTIGAGYGGTGIASYTAGDLVYATGSTTLAKLGIGSSNYLLSSSGSAPQWTAPGDLTISGGSIQATQARGLRETSGPTTLAVGVVADGKLLARSGSSVVGVSVTGGDGITLSTDGSGNITIESSAIFTSALNTALSVLVGLGIKGNVTFDGSAVTGFSVAIVGSDCTYILTSSDLVVPDWDTVTVNTSVYRIIITTKGMVPKVKNWVQTGSNDCIIDWPATSASAGTAGVGSASVANARLLGGGTGGAGRTSSAVGNPGVAAAGVALGRQGATGGKGNNGLTAGGAGGALTRAWAPGGKYGDLVTVLLALGAEEMGASTATRYGLSGGTGGGSGGTSGATTSGGGGGGSGPIILLLRTATISGGGKLIMRLIAGNGGNAAAIGNVSAGGGAGGAPGTAILIVNSLTGVIQVVQTGGNGGNASIAGAATSANGGDGGPAGECYVLYGSIADDGISMIQVIQTPGNGGTKAGTGTDGATGAAGSVYMAAVT